jgi:ubiquinol-cytochrome c reductase iron-sulfur subunit
MADTSTHDKGIDKKRRYLLVATSAAGGAAGVGAAIPFILSLFPSARAKAAGAPVEADLSKVEPGMMIRVEWRSMPVWVLHRTPEMLERLKSVGALVADPNSKGSVQPPYAANEFRARKPEWLVLVGICTHLGCSPADKLKAGPDSGLGEDWPGGFFCPCHGSKFDLAGRVYKDVPAPTNLVVPKYQFLTDTRLLIGDDGTGA